MKKFIKHYRNPNEERINYDIINHTHDDNLINYIVNSCKSLEILKNIKFLGYEFIDDESKIDINDYISTRQKVKQTKDADNKKVTEKYMYLQDSRYGELKLKFNLNCKNKSKLYTKKLLVPIPDENGYYTIKGKKYFLIYQLVDSSTYTTKQNLILKSLMPLSLKRNKKEYPDTQGETYIANTYGVFVFRKEVDVLLFYFAKMGVEKTLKYFSVDSIIEFTENETDLDKYIYFRINKKMLIKVNRFFFNKYLYVQSIVFMIMNVSNNRLSFEFLNDIEYWIGRIGSLSATMAYNYYEKGLNTLIFFDRLIDETTKNILKIDYEHRKNVYSVIRWMIQNFDELRKKDNMSIDNKRLRCNEYIASLLTKAFSKRMNRVISLGKKMTLENIEEIFKFPGDMLIQNLHDSGLLRFDRYCPLQ